MAGASARCCIVGGGPAGMMLGFLLARAGVDVVVLEKHGDFLRDFRGDTVHPSTLDVMDELGLLDAFLKLPHQEVARFSAPVRRAARAGCRLLAPAGARPFHRPDAAMGLPQLSRRAGQALSRLQAADECRGDRPDRGRRPGDRACARPPRGSAGHPRRSGRRRRRPALDRARSAPGWPSRMLGAPMDVLWFRVSRTRRPIRPRPWAASMPAASW